jgi:hypothetical protein
MSWDPEKIVSENALRPFFIKPYIEKRKSRKAIHFGILAQRETKCFTKSRVPEYYA